MSAYGTIRGKGFAFLLLLWSLWFFIMLIRTIVGPILPLIEDEFVIGHARATTLVSLLAWAHRFRFSLRGVFAGKLGYKKTILLSLAISVGLFLLIARIQTFSHLAVLFFTLGFVTGTYFPCIIPIVTAHFAPLVWGRALAIQDTGASLSVLAGPLLAILMLKFYPGASSITLLRPPTAYPVCCSCSLPMRSK